MSSNRNRRHSPHTSRPLVRKLAVESLEDRRLLAITVSTLSDVVDGDFTPGNYSLREAIANAASGEVITFSVTGAINLTNVGHVGELVINKQLTIQGPGANLLTIKAFDPNVIGFKNGDGSRVFNIDDGNSSMFVDVTISGVTLTDGDVAGDGGAIRSQEHLTIQNSVITGNYAFGANGGGGVFASGSNVTITASTIADNYAISGGGGGLRIEGQQLTITSSTLSGNTAHQDGGGIHFSNGSATITNSTVSGNTAYGYGGGLRLRTYAGNVVAIRHSTITNNGADTVSTGGSTGGGVFVTASSVTLPQFDHTIVAGNFQNFIFTPDDINGSVTSTFSLIGSNTGSNLAAGFPDANGNLIGTGAAPVPSRLGALGFNGGATKTHAPATGSPAIDKGSSNPVGAPLYDQRGAPFLRVFDGDGVPGARIDIGAYERQNLGAPQTLVVDTLVDESDGNHSAGNLSLREAIALANNNAGIDDTIVFAPSLTSGGPATILLTFDELEITEAASINGPGQQLLTIDARGYSSIFDISARVGDFTISDLTLTRGGGSAVISSDTTGTLTLYQSTVRSSSSGGVGASGDLVLVNSTVRDNGDGGISANNVTLTNSTVSGNSVNTNIDSHYSNPGFGGGINAYIVTLTNSTVSGNTAVYGGGIYAEIVTLTNSTVSDNNVEATGDHLPSTFGGGIAANIVTLTNSTVSGNHATTGASRGGGIFAWVGVTLVNSTVSGNTVGADASNKGGGIYSRGYVTLANSTVSGNQANGPGSLGGGVYQYDSNGDASLSVSGSIIAGNSATVGSPDLAPDPESIAVANSVSYSLIGDTTGLSPSELAAINGGAGNLINQNALLGPLADNGGPTQTHALLAGSPALDAGDPNFNPADPDGDPMTDDALPHDQRGAPFARVVGGRIDMGAFEAGVPPADFDDDEDVDGDDFLLWQRGLGSLAIPPGSGADGNANGLVDAGDLVVWRATFGTIADAYGNDAASATTIAAPSTQAGNINSPTDVDWFRFTPTVNTFYAFDVSLQGLGSSALRLFGSDGTTVYSSDVNGGASQLFPFMLAGYTYYLEVSGVGGATGAYQLVVTQDDHGILAAGATVVATPSTTAGLISAPQDGDWFRFTAVAGQDYEFQTTLGTLANSVMRLIDPDETTSILIDGGAGSSQFSWTAPAGGDYFIEVYGFNGALGTYSLTVTPFNDGDDHGNSAPSATALTLPVSTAGVLEAPGDVDWFSFAADAGAHYLFSVRAESLPFASITLYDVNGVSGLPFINGTPWTAPDAGVYYIEVSGIGTGEYALQTSNVASLAIPSVTPGEIETPGDSNWYALSALAGVTYRLETSPGTSHIIDVSLYDAAGQFVTGASGPSASFDWTAPEDGPYFIEVYSSGNGTYELSASNVTPLAAAAAIAGVAGVPLYDQRGFAFARVVGGRIDMGAFESGAASANFDGDVDIDRDVDDADFTVWKTSFGNPVAIAPSASPAQAAALTADDGASALSPANVDAALAYQEMLAETTVRRPFRPRLTRAR